jgi:hypothetical protein
VQLQSGDEECLKVWQLLCHISRTEFQKVLTTTAVILFMFTLYILAACNHSVSAMQHMSTYSSNAVCQREHSITCRYSVTV